MVRLEKGAIVNANPNFIEVQKFLAGVDYPAGKDDLIRTAEQSGAGDEVLNALRDLPDRQFENPTEVSEQVAR